MEIPLDWPGNEALAPKAAYTGVGREVMGYLDPE